MPVQYTSTVRFESETYPGVTFDIHKPSYGRKMEFDTLNADFRDKVREISKQHAAVRAEYDAVNKAHGYEMDRQFSDVRRALATAREEEIPALNAQLAALEGTPEPDQEDLLDQMEALGTESLRLTSTMYNPARLRWGLAAIAGIGINGVIPDADLLLKSGPMDLTVEILNAIDGISGLTGEQLKNLPSPITFSALVAATKTNTTVDAANEPDSISAATAAE